MNPEKSVAANGVWYLGWMYDRKWKRSPSDAMAQMTRGKGTIPPRRLKRNYRQMDLNLNYLAVRPINAPILTTQAAQSQPTYSNIYGMGASAFCN